jgi:hypothetical protein
MNPAVLDAFALIICAAEEPPFAPDANAPPRA